jgi:site-specific DNA-methyltransferase (adenine-specific)
LEQSHYVIETLLSEKNVSNLSNFQQNTMDWMNRIYCQSSENMFQIPDGSIAIAFTLPSYNNGEEYNKNLNLKEYLLLLARVKKKFLEY